MRSSTLTIFLVALLFAITLAFADEIDATTLEKRQYGGTTTSLSSTIELSFVTFAMMVFTTLFAL